MGRFSFLCKFEFYYLLKHIKWEPTLAGRSQRIDTKFSGLRANLGVHSFLPLLRARASLLLSADGKSQSTAKSAYPIKRYALSPAVSIWLHPYRAESEADCQCFIDVPHGFFVERAPFSRRRRLSSVRICSVRMMNPHQSVVRRTDRDMRRHFRLVDLRCNSGGDHGRTVRLPTLFCTISTGRMPPCSLPTTGLRSA